MPVSDLWDVPPPATSSAPLHWCPMPVTPPLMPPARIENVPSVGEMFVRDSGPGTAQRGTVLLLHGWMFPSDLNWFACYQPLIDAGYRVVATDARGHGRGLRSTEPFRLDQCADDTARLLRHLDLAPVDVVGY